VKRYLVFGGQLPQRSGGWEDFKGDASELIDGAISMAHLYQWAHIVDTQQKRIVYSGKFVEGKWIGGVIPV
jgi:hypothetical protein